MLDPVLPERAAIAQAQGACRPVQALRSAGARELAAAFDDLLTQVTAPDTEPGPRRAPTRPAGP